MSYQLDLCIPSFLLAVGIIYVIVRAVGSINHWND